MVLGSHFRTGVLQRELPIMLCMDLGPCVQSVHKKREEKTDLLKQNKWLPLKKTCGFSGWKHSGKLRWWSAAYKELKGRLTATMRLIGKEEQVKWAYWRRQKYRECWKLSRVSLHCYGLRLFVWLQVGTLWLAGLSWFLLCDLHLPNSDEFSLFKTSCSANQGGCHQQLTMLLGVVSWVKCLALAWWNSDRCFVTVGFSCIFVHFECCWVRINSFVLVCFTLPLNLFLILFSVFMIGPFMFA